MTCAFSCLLQVSFVYKQCVLQLLRLTVLCCTLLLTGFASLFCLLFFPSFHSLYVIGFQAFFHPALLMALSLYKIVDVLLMGTAILCSSFCIAIATVTANITTARPAPTPTSSSSHPTMRLSSTKPQALQLTLLQTASHMTCQMSLGKTGDSLQQVKESQSTAREHHTTASGLPPARDECTRQHRYPSSLATSSPCNQPCHCCLLEGGCGLTAIPLQQASQSSGYPDMMGGVVVVVGGSLYLKPSSNKQNSQQEPM